MLVIRSLRVAALAVAVLVAAAVLGVVSPEPVLVTRDQVLRTQPPGATALLHVVWLTR
jgi:hypothetical protein